MERTASAVPIGCLTSPPWERTPEWTLWTVLTGWTPWTVLTGWTPWTVLTGGRRGPC